MCSGQLCVVCKSLLNHYTRGYALASRVGQNLEPFSRIFIINLSLSHSLVIYVIHSYAVCFIARERVTECVF